MTGTPGGWFITHHDEDDRHGNTKLFLHVVDVVPRVANAEVENHGRDRARHQVRSKSFPYLTSNGTVHCEAFLRSEKLSESLHEELPTHTGRKAPPQPKLRRRISMFGVLTGVFEHQNMSAGTWYG